MEKLQLSVMEKKWEGIRMRNKFAAILNLVEEDEKLKPLTKRRPIASLPFACRYRLIDFPFSSLYNAEAISAALFISGSGHSLYDHIRSGSTWGLDSLAGGGVFTHSQIRLKTEHTSGDELEPFYYEDHYNYIMHAKSEYVLLIGSSMLANIQLDSLIHYHEDKESDVTVAYKNVSRNELSEQSVFSRYLHDENNDGAITGLEPLKDTPFDSSKISVGMEVMVLGRQTFLEYLSLAQERNDYINVNNFTQYALEAGNDVYGFEYTGYLKAIEDIQSYFTANMDMLDEDNFNALFYRADPVLTKAKNSAPTYYGPTAHTNHSQFANDCEIYGNVEDSLLFRRVKVKESAKVKNSIIMQDCTIEKGAELNYVILDKRVHVKEGVKLEGTPENPIVINKNQVLTPQGE